MTVSEMAASCIPEAALLESRLFSAEGWTEQDLFDSLRDPSRFFLAAFDGGNFIGFCGVQQSCEQGDLLTIGVSPDFRCRGAGSALLKEAIDLFRMRGGAKLFLEVRASNSSARRLYERHGFAPIAVRKSYYQSPCEDGVVYCWEVKE